MFEEVEHVVASVVDGYRCCIFAYGITGGGKTYTMQGPASGACSAISLAQSSLIDVTFPLHWSLSLLLLFYVKESMFCQSKPKLG